MNDTVVTRIKLPEHVHRDVKAEAARHGINLDLALGMCVAYLSDFIVPLSWRDNLTSAEAQLSRVADGVEPHRYTDS